MNHHTSDHDDETSAPPGTPPAPPAIDPELLGRLADEDPIAWAQFLGMIHDSACAAIQRALRGDPEKPSVGVRRLIRAYRNDDLQIQAALLTARTSLQRHLLNPKRTGDLPQDVDHVAALIRIAYNHWQRQNYRDRQSAEQTAAGGAAGMDGGPTLLERAADPSPGPDRRATSREIVEIIYEVIHEYCKGHDDATRAVIFLKLFTTQTQSRIAQEVGVTNAKVSRVCDVLFTHLRRWYRVSLE
jgi:hypothetical protein